MIVLVEQGQGRIVNFRTQMIENSNFGNKPLKPMEIMGSMSDDGFGSYRFEEEREDVDEETEGLLEEEGEKERGLELAVVHQVGGVDSWNKSKFEEFSKFLGFFTA